jgi:hypothetical protein
VTADDAGFYFCEVDSESAKFELQVHDPQQQLVGNPEIGFAKPISDQDRSGIPDRADVEAGIADRADVEAGIPDRAEAGIPERADVEAGIPDPGQKENRVADPEVQKSTKKFTSGASLHFRFSSCVGLVIVANCLKHFLL